jgi:DNA-binding NtrC family response regulator
MNGAPQPEGTQSSLRSYPWTQPLTATILLAEDEPAVRIVTREALELGGFQVIEADGPDSALRVAADNSIRIDVLLTDIIMPGMNGADLARRIRLSRPNLVTLFMTGYAESEAVRLAALEFRHQYIQKPFTVSDLLTRVADALSSRGCNRSSQAPQCPSP